jgi:tissue factor pathway inhibitor
MYRFYYNKELHECKYFFYGGCEGNANNFEHVEDCEKQCVKGEHQEVYLIIDN